MTIEINYAYDMSITSRTCTLKHRCSGKSIELSHVIFREIFRRRERSVYFFNNVLVHHFSNVDSCMKNGRNSWRR